MENRFVIDISMLTKACASENEKLYVDILAKFIQSDTKFLVCFDNGDLILNEYKNAATTNIRLKNWLHYLRITSRFTGIDVNNEDDIYLSTAETYHKGQIIAGDKDYYYRNYKDRARSVDILDHQEAINRLMHKEDNTTNIFQRNDGKNGTNTVIASIKSNNMYI